VTSVKWAAHRACHTVTDKKLLHLIATAGVTVRKWFNTAISATEVSDSETDETNYGRWFRHDT